MIFICSSLHDKTDGLALSVTCGDTSPKGRGFGKKMKFAWTAKGSHFGGAGEQSETERASPLIFLVLLFHSGALVHLIQLHSAGLGIGAGHIRGDYAVAV